MALPVGCPPPGVQVELEGAGAVTSSMLKLVAFEKSWTHPLGMVNGLFTVHGGEPPATSTVPLPHETPPAPHVQSLHDRVSVISV